MDAIEKQLKSHPFVTPWFLQNPHLQTFLHKSTPSFKTLLPKSERRYITLADGSQIGADCFFQQNYKEHKTIVIMNGILGSTRSFFHKVWHISRTMPVLM